MNIVNDSQYVPNGCTPNTVNENFNVAITSAKVPAMAAVLSTNLNWLLHKMFRLRDFDFCKKLIEQQMEQNYNQEYLYYIKGLILREEGQHQEALKCFQRTIEFDSKNASNYKEIGKTLFKMGKYNQSLEIFLKAESYLESPDHEVYHYIGELLCMNANSRQAKTNILDAKEYFKRAIMSGKQIQTYKILAGIFRKEKDYLKSIELLESSLQVSPGNVDLFADLGVMYLKVNEVERAHEKFQEAININPKHSNSLLAMGAILQTKNEIDAALNVYKNIPNIQDESFEVWCNIGMCFYRKNKLIASISCLKKALWLCPLNYNVLYNLGMVLMTAQQFASAFQCFVSAVSMKSESAECYMMLAICLFYLDDIENSQVAFRKSILSSAAIKNPLIYLNYSIFCLDYLKSVDETQQYMNNFYSLCETIKVPSEYMQIAEKLLLRLPTSNPEYNEMQTLSNQQIQETKISFPELNDGTTKDNQQLNEIADSSCRDDNRESPQDDDDSV